MNKSASLDQQQQRFRQAERHRLRCQRRGMSLSEQQQAGVLLLHQLRQLTAYDEAQTVASYCCDDGEISTDAIHQRAWSDNKDVFLPVIQGDQQLRFSRYRQHDELVTGPWGIKHPKVLNLTNDAALDIVLVPLVAFDQQGNRLGRGGGFYDRFLSRCSNTLFIGLAHEFQHINHLPSADWDIPVDAIIMPNKTFICR